MSHEDQVDLAEGLEVLVLRRHPGVQLQEGIDHDHLAGGAGDAEGRMAQPQHLDRLRTGGTR
jgi:hypothetical protein